MANITLGNETLVGNSACRTCTAELTMAIVFGCMVGVQLLYIVVISFPRFFLRVKDDEIVILSPGDASEEERITTPGLYYRPSWTCDGMVKRIATGVHSVDVPIHSRTKDGLGIALTLTLKVRNVPEDDFLEIDRVQALAVAAIARVTAAELHVDTICASVKDDLKIFGDTDDLIVDSLLQPTLDAVYVTKIE
jgi:hypothetical protein